MKEKAWKITAAALSAAVCISSVGIGAGALASKKAEKHEAPASAGTLLKSAEEPDSAVKDETVYVIANADGSVQKIIVSDWLKNTLGESALTDASDLSGAKNVKTDAGYSVNGDGALVWDAQGEDIYYQGESSAELPVDLKVCYQLDGKAISAEELAGKSGRVTIRFDYENRQYETVEINGKQEKIYVPFAMLTGVILDNDSFRNVEVSNGRILNDGSRTIVAGLAFPGMQENLGLDTDALEIPSHVEITADVTDFSLSMTVTLATNGLFNEIDPDGLTDPDDLTDAVDQLNDAMSQLMDGSSQLYDGLTVLLEKSGDLVSGIHQLADGAAQLKSGSQLLADGAGALKDGTASLADGAGTLKDGTASLSDGAGKLKDGTASLYDGAAQMQAGMEQLAAGLGTLTENNDTLNAGAKQVFDTLLATANTQIAAAGLECPALTVENYAQTLTAVIASLDEDAVYQTALTQVTAAVEANRAYITGQVTAAVQAQVMQQVQAAVTEQVAAAVTEQVEANADTIRAAVIQQAAGMTAEQYAQAVAAGMISEEQQAAVDAAVASAIQNTVDEQLASEEVRAQIAELTEQNTTAQMQTAEMQAAIAQNVEAQVQKAIAENMASDTVLTQLAAASAGAQSLIALKTQLDSYNAFYLGLQQYTAGVSDAAAGVAALQSGADALKSGAAQLDSGAGDLQSGAAQLDTGAGALQSGAVQLDIGAGDLKSGAQELNQGMQTLYDGILQLENGTPALVSGVEQLQDGAMQLSDGLSEFNEQGIKKLSDAVNGDLSGLLSRIRATVEVSQRYRTFSGISEDMSGAVKFIYKTEGISAE